MKTAVEWLLENLISEPHSEKDFKYNSECWEKAKEMEKNQLSHFYSCGTFDEYSRNVRNAEELYNETFKQQ
jgi:hypothetical protein